MPGPNFLSRNATRSFPLLKHYSKETADTINLLPYSVIVDFGSIAYGRALYTQVDNVVWLHEVRRNAGQFEFEFRSNAPGLEGRSLTFQRDLNDDDFVTEYADAHPSELDVSLSESECINDTDWSGYLVTHSMEELREVLPTDGTVLEGSVTSAITERALTRSLAGTGIRSINIANTDRTRAEPPSGCKDFTYDTPPQDIWLQKTCLSGPVVFREGFNTKIVQNPVTGTVTISAAVGAGLGEVCEEVPIHSKDKAPRGQELLSGGPSCDSTIRSINGVPGPSVGFSGGVGVDIVPDVANNQLIVDVNLSDLAICYETPEDVSQSTAVSPATDPNIYCGPA